MWAVGVASRSHRGSVAHHRGCIAFYRGSVAPSCRKSYCHNELRRAFPLLPFFYLSSTGAGCGKRPPVAQPSDLWSGRPPAEAPQSSRPTCPNRGPFGAGLLKGGEPPGATRWHERRACVRRATEKNRLEPVFGLPARLLPPHPTVPRTVGLRTACPEEALVAFVGPFSL